MLRDAFMNEQTEGLPYLSAENKIKVIAMTKLSDLMC